MDKKETIEEIKFKITHSEDKELGISLTRCTVIDNGNIVYDTITPTRYFLHNNTMTSKFYRWLFELNNDASNSTQIRKSRYNTLRQRWIGRLEILQLRIQKLYLQTKLFFAKLIRGML